MKQKELFVYNVRVGRKDFGNCFHKLGVLKNGLGIENKNMPGHFYSINTVHRCEWYLFKHFNNTYGAEYWNTKKSSIWNWKNHPKYLDYIEETKEWMNRVKGKIYFINKTELTKWMKSLSFDQQAIVLSYVFIINIFSNV